MKTSRLSAAVAACLPADPDAPVLMIGSHYDTVHDGGKYDGALGIIVGISAVKAVLLEVGGRAGGISDGGWLSCCCRCLHSLHAFSAHICWPVYPQTCRCVPNPPE
jgi:hypothetical protein